MTTLDQLVLSAHVRTASGALVIKFVVDVSCVHPRLFTYAEVSKRSIRKEWGVSESNVVCIIMCGGFGVSETYVQQAVSIQCHDMSVLCAGAEPKEKRERAGRINGVT